MSRDYHMKSAPEGTGLVSYKSYVIGFVLSVIFTLGAYTLVVIHINSGHTWPPDAVLTPILVVLALIQFAIQLKFFLHLGNEAKPRWKVLVFSFMVLVVGILVIGSLWIMNHLNYHLSPDAAGSAIMHDEGIHK